MTSRTSMPSPLGQRLSQPSPRRALATGRGRPGFSQTGRGVFVFAAALLLALGAHAARAQDDAAAPASVQLTVGRVHLIKTTWRISSALVSEPKIVDIQSLSPTQVAVMARETGVTDVVLSGENDQSLRLRVEVRLDQAGIEGQLKSLFPQANLKVTQVGSTVIVTGDLRNADQSDRLNRLLKDAGAKQVDLTRVAGLQQVQIKVRVVEVDRRASRSLGITAFKTSEDFFGVTNFGTSNQVTIHPKGDSISALGAVPFGGETIFTQPSNLIAGFPSANLEFFIDALAQNSYLRVLAEPNLVALNGEEADFLAGGEVPIPAVQNGAGGSSGSISIEYKEFGVRLRFRPVVLGDNTIRLKITAEVSDLFFDDRLQIQGSRVPELLSRRASSTLELKSGQTFGMAGLISNRIDALNSHFPGLGSLPVIGALFRSVRYEKDDTEMIVLVTADLVEPLSQTMMPPVPGDAHIAPSDWELYAAGKIEGKAPARLSNHDARYLRDLGLHRLKGPGAWATYDQPMAHALPGVRPAPATQPAAGPAQP